MTKVLLRAWRQAPGNQPQAANLLLDMGAGFCNGKLKWRKDMRIIIVDDDTLVTLSLKTILENEGDITVCATGSSGREAVELFREHRPDVILLDIRMKEMDGIMAGEEILSFCPEARILYLTTFSDDEYIIKALKMGAKGYILKQDYKGIAPALRVIVSGQSVFGQAISEKMPLMMGGDRRISSDYEDITDKEQELISWVAKGLNNREIAERMYLSEGTVRNYISRLLEKLELRDRTQLAVFYYTSMRG